MHSSSSRSQPHLVVALDFADRAAALALAQRLDATVCAVKVGFELFVAAGPAVVEDLQRLGFRVFLDLKFHDIPNTVASACRRAVDLGVWMLNVHASGGAEMLRAAREAVPLPRSDADPHLLAVTVLTSSDRTTLAGIGLDLEPAEQVARLARLAVQDCGVDGLVCSAHEAAMLRTLLGSKPWLVTPGIRPCDAEHDDQKRVVTPADAFASGVSHIVVGRPITRAADPAAAARAIAAMGFPDPR